MAKRKRIPVAKPAPKPECSHVAAFKIGIRVDRSEMRYCPVCDHLLDRNGKEIKGKKKDREHGVD